MPEQTALLTGCSSGIGRAAAAAFAEDDWAVYATGRDGEALGDLAEAGCRTATLDATEPADVERVVDRIEAETGRVDALVNAAGYGQFGPLEDVPVERLHRQFDANVYGPHRLSRAVLGLMREAGDGTIVNVSDAHARLATPGTGAYAASTAALEAASDALRAEVEGFGVDVVLVEPGPVATAFQERATDATGDLPRGPEYEWVYDAIDDGTEASLALPITSDPEDVATVIHDAACVDDPKARYPVGTFAKWSLYARFLPHSLRDSAFGLMRRFL